MHTLALQIAMHLRAETFSQVCFSIAFTFTPAKNMLIKPSTRMLSNYVQALQFQWQEALRRKCTLHFCNSYR